MKPFFKPEDFEIKFYSTSSQEASDQANAKLEKLIDASPVVYGYDSDGYLYYSDNQNQADTHSVRLLFIEKIPKKECIHEPYIRSQHIDKGIHIECKHCGVELKATWEAVK